MGAGALYIIAEAAAVLIRVYFGGGRAPRVSFGLLAAGCGASTIVVKAGLSAVCRGAGRESAIVAALAQDHFNDVFTNSGGKVSLVHAELGNLLTERMAFGNGLCG